MMVTGEWRYRSFFSGVYVNRTHFGRHLLGGLSMRCLFYSSESDLLHFLCRVLTNNIVFVIALNNRIFKFCNIH